MSPERSPPPSASRRLVGRQIRPLPERRDPDVRRRERRQGRKRRAVGDIVVLADDAGYARHPGDQPVHRRITDRANVPIDLARHRGGEPDELEVIPGAFDVPDVNVASGRGRTKIQMTSSKRRQRPLPVGSWFLGPCSPGCDLFFAFWCFPAGAPFRVLLERMGRQPREPIGPLTQFLEAIDRPAELDPSRRPVEVQFGNLRVPPDQPRRVGDHFLEPVGGDQSRETGRQKVEVLRGKLDPPLDVGDRLAEHFVGRIAPVPALEEPDAQEPGGIGRVRVELPGPAHLGLAFLEPELIVDRAPQNDVPRADGSIAIARRTTASASAGRFIAR